MKPELLKMLREIVFTHWNAGLALDVMALEEMLSEPAADQADTDRRIGCLYEIVGRLGALAHELVGQWLNNVNLTASNAAHDARLARTLGEAIVALCDEIPALHAPAVTRGAA